MVKAYWKILPALHVPNTYDKLVPLRQPPITFAHAAAAAPSFPFWSFLTIEAVNRRMRGAASLLALFELWRASAYAPLHPDSRAPAPSDDFGASAAACPGGGGAPFWGSKR